MPDSFPGNRYLLLHNALWNSNISYRKLFAHMAEAGYLRCTVLRIANPYGRLLPAIRMQGFIEVSLNLIRNSQAVPIIGSDEVVKDYLHLHGFNSAVRKVVQLAVPDKFSIINIGLGRGISVREILEIIKIAIRRKIEVEYCSLPHGAIVPEWNVLNCAKAKKYLDWEPAVEFEGGIVKMCEKYFPISQNKL